MRVKKIGIVSAILAACLSIGSGCGTLEGVLNTRNLNKQIKDACLAYEKVPDWTGLKNYVEQELARMPRPEGWGTSTETLLSGKKSLAEQELLLAEMRGKHDRLLSDGKAADAESYLASLLGNPPKGWNDKVAREVRELLAKLLRTRIQAQFDAYVADGKLSEANAYLESFLKAAERPAGWDSSVEALVKQLQAKLKKSLGAQLCAKLWENVKAALDVRDFAKARQLTSMAAPDPQAVDAATRNEVMTYRIGILNEVVNPYQSDWIIYEMKAKVRTLSKRDAIAYVKSVPLIKDEFPTIHQKVEEIAPGLGNLYWLDDRIRAYVDSNRAKIQQIMDTRNVHGSYRDYKEVFALVDKAVAEMKDYNPRGRNDSDVDLWEGSLKHVRRVMTTAEANAAISSAKDAILETLK